MIPILYSKNETAFNSNGLGSLADVISCKVTEELNGLYELEMQYPVDGLHYNDISVSEYILAKPSETADPQPFSIYKISKPINETVTIYAEHISYRLSHIPVKPFTDTGLSNVLTGLTDNAVETCPFSFYTDITDTESEYTQENPYSLRECLGGIDGSILEIFGGEFEWNKFEVHLWQNRGNNTGVTIEYGKNLTDFRQEESIESTSTGIYPYWKDSEGAYVTCETTENPQGTFYSPNASNFPYKRTVVADFSSVFETEPTVEAMAAYATALVESSDFGVPEVNMEISFVALWQTEEYKNIAPLERVKLGDSVTVRFSKLGVNATAKVIKTEYNTLIERYESLTLGDAKSSLDKTISGLASSNANSVTKEELQNGLNNTKSTLREELEEQTDLINGVLGGNIVVNTDANGHPYEVIIGDDDDVEQMLKCIRANYLGIGFSTNGPSGPYNLAMTIDGVINGNYIGAGTIHGNKIQAGTINASSLTVGAKEELESVTLKIDSSRGTVFRSENDYTELSVTIYKGNEAITNATRMRALFGSNAYLQWYWLKVGDTQYTAISSSDPMITEEGFKLTVSPAAFDKKVTFKCEIRT